MTTARKISTPRPLAALAASFIVLLTLALAVGGAAQAESSSEGCTGSYGWPVKPFDQAHPIRGSFGDPRTIFAGPPTLDTLLAGSGRFSFHQGVDISAPNGEAVYAVASGRVVGVDPEWVRVDCGNGRSFQYWHIRPSVRVGARVEAGKTVLGSILKPSAHVHLTHFEDGRVVNPVARMRLTPYRDTTLPQVLGIGIRREEDARDELPQFVRGRVYLVAEAVDSPALRVPGIWRDLPVTPARLNWRIEKWTGRVVVGERVARDVRESLPGDELWGTFARGTFQNMSVFGRHYSYLQAGRYLFKLSVQSFDTRTLHDGVYELVVTAEDIAGNRAVRRLRFTVHNEPGWR